MTDQDIFEQAIFPSLRHDPRTNLNQIILDRFGQFNDYYKRQDRFNQFKPYPRIVNDFMKSYEVEAFAMKHNEAYVLCISESVSGILYGLFNSLLSSKQILPLVGDVSQENDELGMFDYQKFVTPKDPIRRKYAFHLTITTMDFLVEHELAHILNGHCDFVLQKFMKNYISESQLNTLYRDNLDYQTLEMDADCIAASRCVNHICNIISGDSTVHNEYQIFYENIYDSIFHFSFGVSTLFHLFGEVDYKNMDIGKTTHPNTHLREYMVRGAIVAWFLQSSNQLTQKGMNVDQSKLVDSLGTGYIQAIIAYNKTTGRTLNKEKYKHQYTSGHPLIQAVKDNWKVRMYHALTPFTFQKLVPPK